jgi:hypothetical protein
LVAVAEVGGLNLTNLIFDGRLKFPHNNVRFAGNDGIKAENRGFLCVERDNKPQETA